MTKAGKRNVDMVKFLRGKDEAGGWKCLDAAYQYHLTQHELRERKFKKESEPAPAPPKRGINRIFREFGLSVLNAQRWGLSGTSRVHVRTEKSSPFHSRLHALGLGMVKDDYERQASDYSLKAKQVGKELKQLVGEAPKALLQ